MMERRAMRVMTSGLIATFMLAATALAQGQTAYVIPSVPAPRDPLPRFTIALRGALAPVGLPLPPIGLQPQVRERERIQGSRRGHEPLWFQWPMIMFYVPHPVTPAPIAEPPKPVQEPPAPGRLILEIEPPHAQVFADGYYVGVPADFSAARGGGVLEAGSHRIDVSATGYEPLTIDLRVTPGQPVTLRAVLSALPPPTAVPPSTYYLIPGCYMGNIPPKDAHLPATCDQSRVTTWRP